MFKMNYRIRPVNLDKNVYSLQLTTGSWIKLFAWSAAPFAVMYALTAYNEVQEQREIEDLENLYEK